MIEHQLSVAEVRAALGVSRTTLWRLCRAGRLPMPRLIAARRVAWPESEIDAYLRSCARAPGVAA